MDEKSREALDYIENYATKEAQVKAESWIKVGGKIRRDSDYPLLEGGIVGISEIDGTAFILVREEDEFTWKRRGFYQLFTITPERFVGTARSEKALISLLSDTLKNTTIRAVNLEVDVLLGDPEQPEEADRVEQLSVIDDIIPTADVPSSAVHP
jgi:hypothetical protein